VSWSLNNSKEFSVKPHTQEALALRFHNIAVDSIVLAAWKKLAPPKVEIVIWLALLGKLQLLENY